AEGLAATVHELRRRLGVTAREERDLLAPLDGLLRKIGNDAFGAAVQPRRHTLVNGCNLGYPHEWSPSARTHAPGRLGHADDPPPPQVNPHFRSSRGAPRRRGRTARTATVRGGCRLHRSDGHRRRIMSTCGEERAPREIGRASCRERGEVRVVAGAVEKKNGETPTQSDGAAK